MKRTLLLALAIMALSALKAQTNEVVLQAAEKKPAEVLEFKVTEYDFGKIPQNKPVYYSFEIKNTGNTPLKLDNVQAACGCTTPEWSRDPIAPGETALIKVGYNAASEGYFDKPITITYNGNQVKQIKIKGMVWKAPVGAAPANPSLHFLKQQIQ